MPVKKNKFDSFSPELKAQYLDQIIAFFAQERGETIGVIAAEELFEFFLNNFAEGIYQQGIRDSQKLVKEKVADLEFELESLTSTN
jgi:uncharacterized protein (DUF2164 family)